MFGRTVLRPVVESAMTDWQRSRSSKSSPWECAIMLKQARRARLLTISGFMIMLFSALGFMATPLFGLHIRAVNNITDLRGDRVFPLQSYYPFDATRSPLFELVYASQLIGGCFVAICFSVPDNFFGALVFHVSAQFEILGARMSQTLFTDCERVAGWRRTKGRSFLANLKRIVDTHEHLIRYVKAIENTFNLLVLAQVLCLTLTICNLGLGVVTSLGNDSQSFSIVQILTLGGAIANQMVHMFVYCIASEILAEHSTGCFKAVYYSGWYLLPSKQCRALIPIMVRSQLPLQLSAGKFVDLSLNTYRNIIRSSFGYVAVLLAVTE